MLQEFFLKTVPESGNTPSLQLGLAFGASIYFLRDGKRLSLGAFSRIFTDFPPYESGISLKGSVGNAVRACGLTAAGLLVGTLLGSALQSWLRVDIVPIGVSSAPQEGNLSTPPDSSWMFRSIVNLRLPAICGPGSSTFTCSAQGGIYKVLSFHNPDHNDMLHRSCTLLLCSSASFRSSACGCRHTSWPERCFESQLADSAHWELC